MSSSVSDPVFRNSFGEAIFRQKYRHDGCETWSQLAKALAFEVCGDHMPSSVVSSIEHMIAEMKFIPGGRYLYYAGRPLKYYNNCYLLRCESDSREDWANLAHKATSCLMTGGGIGSDYSVYRPSGSRLGRTGGIASGPLPAMEMVNEIGRRVMQGGSRRSAIYASLDREHEDVLEFLRIKNWHERRVAGTDLTYADVKQKDFNFPCPLDYTNISVNYSDEWLATEGKHLDPVFVENCRQALSTGEPGFSFNFGDQARETLRNACTEVTSEDDSDVCNLGSLNLSRISTIDEFRTAVELATIFLLCGTLKADLPYQKVRDVREKNRRLGLGLMGVHEWLLQRGHRYEMNDELRSWLAEYRDGSRKAADEWAGWLSISRPVACRAIAPTGTIGILAGTTTGIEPLFAVAYRRRYLKDLKHHYQYVVDGVAKTIVASGVAPESIETALDLAGDPERRIAFQADVQDYVDMSISSTINLPAWGSDGNGEGSVLPFAAMLAKYAHRLRGFTCYPDGARGGQPLTSVPYDEALRHEGKEFTEEVVDVCSITGKGGFCGS